MSTLISIGTAIGVAFVIYLAYRLMKVGPRPDGRSRKPYIEVKLNGPSHLDQITKIGIGTVIQSQIAPFVLAGNAGSPVSEQELALGGDTVVAISAFWRKDDKSDESFRLYLTDPLDQKQPARFWQLYIGGDKEITKAVYWMETDVFPMNKETDSVIHEEVVVNRSESMKSGAERRSSSRMWFEFLSEDKSIAQRRMIVDEQMITINLVESHSKRRVHLVGIGIELSRLMVR